MNKFNLEEIKQILKDNNQEHLLLGYEKMAEENKEKLLYQISNIDFKLMKELYEKTKREVLFEEEKIEPISYVNKEKLTQEELNKYKSKGDSVIKNGGLALVTMAGGQGTRLGYNGPKGAFILGAVTNKSLFEIACDELKSAKEKYGVIIPWYIMTSEQNNEDTIEFFEENNYFDYPKDAIKFFKQGEIPMIDVNGKIMLEEDYTIKQGADGHGGIFESMLKSDVISGESSRSNSKLVTDSSGKESSVIKDMQEKGIKWIYTGGIDNVLAKPVDPVCIGFGILENVQSVGKSLVKANPKERVGVFCTRNGKPSVIEYTEISEETAELRDENGELVYGEAHILCNMFSMDIIENISKNKLPYHPAFKKATYINENGEKIVGETPNGYKFETFIFDAFGMLNNMGILRVKREEEFAPVKNAEGVDSPETARELYKNYWGI